MRICAIGDPHGNLDKIKEIPLYDIDLILLTGDLGNADKARDMTFNPKEYSDKEEKEAFLETENSTLNIVKYLSDYAPVYIIYGNVESTPHIPGKKQTFAKETNLTKKLTDIPKVRVINNRVANFEGVRIGGLEYFMDTTWVQEFKLSDYKKRMAKAKKQTDKAKRVLRWFDSLDILVCHQPPYGFLDKVTAKFVPKHWQGKHAGSKTILQYIESKSLIYVFCGHIHEGQGMKKIGETEVYNLGVGHYKTVEL